MFGIFKKMRGRSARINDYFANAVRAWLFEGDEVARFAALKADLNHGLVYWRTYIPLE